MRCGEGWRCLRGAVAARYALALGLLALAGCSMSAVRPAATATAPSGTPQEQALTRLAQAAAGTVPVTVTVDPRGPTVKVTATLAGDVARTPAEIAASQERVKAITFALQRALWTGDAARPGEVKVSVLGPLLDDYFDRITDWYGGAQVTATTAASVTWSALTADAAWSAYDVVWLRPYYAPFQQWGAPSPSQP
jgi:hypothetical protein